jgi:hypothetical protein
MKKLVIILFIIIFSCQIFAQIDDILKTIVTTETGVEEEVITTTIKDKIDVVPILADLEKSYPIKEGTDFEFKNLKPGYYRYVLQSYCLKPGLYGPSPLVSKGYYMAPIKGSKSDLIKNIIARSVKHPEIEQKDIQLLIWGIIAQVKFSELPTDLQLKVKPLLKTDEIAMLEINIKETAINELPDELKESIGFYRSLRKRIIDPTMNYQGIEAACVLNDIPPELFITPDNNGTWVNIGENVFIRALPEKYYKTVLEIYMPPVIEVKKDSRNRISLLTNGKIKIEAEYDDSPGADIIRFGNNNYPINRFKRITITSLLNNSHTIIENMGWCLPGSEITKGSNNSLKKFIYYRRDDDPDETEYNAYRQRVASRIFDALNPQNRENATFYDRITEYGRSWYNEHISPGPGIAENLIDFLTGPSFRENAKRSIERSIQIRNERIRREIGDDIAVPSFQAQRIGISSRRFIE